MVELRISRIQPVPSAMPSLGNNQLAMKRAQDAYDEVADQPVAGPAHELAGEPARDKADDQDDEKTFVRQIHD